ncbi:MAG: hypothetical protein PHR52_08945 [Fermentimonas sp.]|nr:hypothetical protein [Fermentimonas sp.]
MKTWNLTESELQENIVYIFNVQPYISKDLFNGDALRKKIFADRKNNDTHYLAYNFKVDPLFAKY